jgi:hypothetical protein
VNTTPISGDTVIRSKTAGVITNGVSRIEIQIAEPTVG